MPVDSGHERVLHGPHRPVTIQKEFRNESGRRERRDRASSLRGVQHRRHGHPYRVDGREHQLAHPWQEPRRRRPQGAGRDLRSVRPGARPVAHSGRRCSTSSTARMSASSASTTTPGSATASPSTSTAASFSSSRTVGSLTAGSTSSTFTAGTPSGREASALGGPTRRSRGNTTILTKAVETPGSPGRRVSPFQPGVGRHRTPTPVAGGSCRRETASALARSLADLDRMCEVRGRAELGRRKASKEFARGPAGNGRAFVRTAVGARRPVNL